MAKPVTVPPVASSLRLLDRIDYEDAHLARTNQTFTADEWGRLILDVAPRQMLSFASSYTNGARLEPRASKRGSPDGLDPSRHGA